ncbi:LOW QUALITY PROTEIN: uncharacterized protein LOC118574701, partial [Onychomys torridus]|uniref:LOW QUALITY PROTEIN: uncharacterized protein LOC118574701 n=1 Tax=Onychomys torridus TaxID=38674 RepID=UPI00167F7461
MTNQGVISFSRVREREEVRGVPFQAAHSAGPGNSSPSVLVQDTRMGQTVATPLSLTLDRWSDVKGRGNNEGVIIKKNKWTTLCEAEWVMMGPSTTPLDSPPPSAPLAISSSSLYPILPRKEALKPSVLPSDLDSPLIDLLTAEPPPYRAAPAAPAAGPETGMTAIGGAAAPEKMATGGDTGGTPAPSPIAGRLRARRDDIPLESKAFPLREGPGRHLQYWPFSASVLYNWKQFNPPFSKDPVALTNLIESILVTHRPTWDDCQQLLQTLLTVEEKQRVFLEARKLVPGEDGRPTQLPNLIDIAFPLTRPNWDYTTDEGRGHLRLYRQLLLAGLHAAARRPTNLAQVRSTIQGREETPAALLERLKEAYRMYTPYDPEDPGQVPGVILSFIYQSSPDIRTKLQRIGGQPITFLVDTGAQHSVLTHTEGPLSDRSALVQGATGSRRYRWTTERKVQLASGQVTHSFLHIPDCPHPLLGRDLLTKLKAQIYFDERGPTVTGPGGTPLQVLALNLEEEYCLFEPEPPEEPPGEMQDWLDRFPQVWAETGGLGLAHDQPPLVISLKASAAPISIRQYPMSREAQEGIKPHIRRLIDQGVLKPCRSPWNTPLLPVKKPGTGEFRPVQDLREVNKRVEDIHPTVPNPYNLLSTLPPTHTWYTVLDLKDAFFCLRLHPQSQLLFAFEWRDPEIGLSGQLTWTRLPQGFKNSPTLFDEALHADLAGFRVEHPTLTLLQYVDDLLLAARSRTECLEGTQALLTRLGEKGYRASVKKAQICQNKVIYLGYTLEGGRRWLTEARKEAIVSIPPSKGPRQVREFLGTAGYCRLWIPGFAELAAPLYPLTKPGIMFRWEEEHQQAFQQIKRALLESPALGLPDLTKPFELFVDENSGFAKGVLVQKLGPWRRPVAYLSKKLDPVATGWPPCLRMVAAIAVLLKDAGKLTLGQPMTVLSSHAVEALVWQPPDRWLSNSRMTHYQALLLDTDRVTFGPTVSLNPATLLPLPASSGEHDCLQILAEAHGTRPDLTDQPLKDSDYVWFMDGSSFLEEGTRRAGAAVTTESEVVWASPLPAGTSAQRAELIALAQALRMAEGKRLTVYTDSRYAFATAHMHGEIYRRRGLLTSEGKGIKNKKEILDLLQALFLPRQLSIMHCPGHQKGNTAVARGNRLADLTARAHRPGTHWEIDFTEVKPRLYGYRYLLVFVDTFSGWMEAFPTKKETANVMAKKLLEDIFPRYGMPQIMGSDNGPAFVSQVSQRVARLLGIDWKLHCAYRPQSSGQVERANRTIKETLTKLTLATGSRDWVLLLPLALYRARNTPGPYGLTPFEIIYGAPPPIVNFLHPDISSFATSPTLEAHLQALQLVQKEVWKPLAAAYREQLDHPIVPHPFQIGDSVWVRRHQTKNLEPRWKGPYTVLLTTPTALKVDGIAAWVHASHVKAAKEIDPTSAKESTWKVQRTQNPLKI